MSAVTRPRGPLPARVYWTRRALVLVLAFVLVWGIGHLLGGGSDGSDGDTAALSGSPTHPSSGPTQTRTSGTANAGPSRSGSPKSTPTRTTTPLAEPDGPCSASEVLVTPQVTDAAAGREVQLKLLVGSTDSAACTWRVSSDTLAVKLTSGSDFIWSSQNCPRSITTQDIVVRKARPVTVTVTWSGRRSDDTCSRTTAFARPGYYHVLAAALGGTPTDVQFELDYPTRPTITVTVQPTNQPTDEPTKRSSSHPTGASEPSNPD